jgi:phage terminase large subunit-like protein
LNGSVLIDETHVVDRPFVKRISRAGISRSEALFAEFSTAGNNPEGYGKERFDYAADVLKGTKIDEELLAIIHAAPQDVTDDQLDEDFDYYAQIANPSLGHTIDPEEIRRDYERSKATIEALNDFKMYRLNVWQFSSNPWLRQSEWAKCAAEYTEADLLGRPCVGGFDMALRWDVAALVLLFPLGEKDGEPTFRLWPYFWLPKESARKMRDSASWFEWEKAGFIHLCDGNTNDIPVIRQALRDARDKFKLQQVAYDERFADTIAQLAQDEDDIKMIDFKQMASNFLEPMSLVEADIMERRIEHPNNLCLNWMAQNATKNRRGMLTKPETDEAKKIDGIVALVMARDMATQIEPPSVYESRGILSLVPETPPTKTFEQEYYEDEDDDY